MFVSPNISGWVLLPQVQFLLKGLLSLLAVCLSEVCVCVRESTNSHRMLCQLGQSLGMYLSTVPGSYANSIVPGVACGVTVNVPSCLSHMVQLCSFHSWE